MPYLEDSRWLSREQLSAARVSGDLRDLLLAPGSLTRVLNRRCQGELELTLMAQQWQRPWHSEKHLLHLASGRYALVREVSMGCQSQPWLYARTLLPPQALRGAARRFLTIGQRPLGALLFGAPGRLRIRRRQRDYAQLHQDSQLYRRIQTLLSTSNEPLWARRTVYQTSAMRFAIIEVFLPALNNRMDS